MAARKDLRDVADRIEALLDGFRGDARSHDRAEELVRLVTDLYGAGLERIVDLVGRNAPDVMQSLLHDELVSGLILLHGLHPDDLPTRLERALASVRPLLKSHAGDVELLDIDEDAGAVQIRLLGSCDGCPSSSATLQGAVEKAIFEAAPEIGIVDVEQPADDTSVPIQLGRKPQYEHCPSELG